MVSFDAPPTHLSDRVTVVGAGTMGGHVVTAFARHGAGVTVVDIDPAARDRSAALPGVIALDQLPDRVAGLVLLSLPGPADVEKVADAITRVAQAGTIVADLSTIDPGTAIQVAARLGEHQIAYLDAPVLGRPAGVGSWTLAVGGDPAVLAAIEPSLIGRIAARAVHVGQTGAGCVLKLMNNLMFGAINAVTAEVLTVCASAGLDPGTFVDTVVSSGAASVSGLFKNIGPRIVSGDFDPTFSLALLHKDNALALELADDHRVPLVVGHAVQTLNTIALREHGARDSSAIINALESVTGVSARRFRAT